MVHELSTASKSFPFYFEPIAAAAASFFSSIRRPGECAGDFIVRVGGSGSLAAAAATGGGGEEERGGGY